jgi:hypothetical protein
MAAETITVYIDPSQLAAQKANDYSLFLAKMVDGQFAVIWQSMGPVATINAPSYESLNTFQLGAPSYQVNYGMITDQGGPTFSASGIAQDIELGQTVVLDQYGIFGGPTNGGVAGQITIDNALLGNPHVILNDGAGNPIFVNLQSGMDIGATTLTPQDTYQIWFDNLQERGTIIAHNVSNAGIFTFGGDTTNPVISYGADGVWRPGPLPGLAQSSEPAPTQVLASGLAELAMLATFQHKLETVSVVYLMNQFIGLFPRGMAPIDVSVQFADYKHLQAWFRVGMSSDEYESAMDQALTRAKANPRSGLGDQTWVVRPTRV